MIHKKHEAYKDSGVEQIGRIPISWSVKQIKQIGILKGGSGFPDADQGMSNNAIKFFKVKALNNLDSESYINIVEDTITEDQAKRLGACVFPSGTIAFAKVGAAVALNRFAFLPSNSCIDNNMIGLQVNDCVEKKFIRYHLLTIDIPSHINPGAVPSLNAKQIGSLYLSLPGIEEQLAISSFLDCETAKIEELIKEHENLIELLIEKRCALITNAVTRGLDPNVKMKDSGVEWLGEVPDTWEIVPLKTMCTLITQKASDKRFPVSLENIESWSGKYIPKETEYSGNGIDFRIGDVLFGKLRPYLAKVWLASRKGEAIGDFFVMRAGGGILPTYLQLLLLNRDFIAIINGSTYGAKMPRVSWNFLSNVPCALPPLYQQNEITKYITTRTLKINQLIQEVLSSIALLKERRSALITAAVTGKIDVRDEVPA